MGKNKKKSQKICSQSLHAATRAEKWGGGGGGGAWGLEPPPLWKQGGLSPLILSHAYTIIVILSVCMSVPSKNNQPQIAVRMPQKCSQGVYKFPKFSGGACPQTPLGGLWAYAHSIIVITVHDQRSEPPPPLLLPVLHPRASTIVLRICHKVDCRDILARWLTLYYLWGLA